MTILLQRANAPSISCVVPAHNEASHIYQFLKVLYGELQRHSQQIEIIVVDDGSTDDTVSSVLNACETLPIRLLELSRNFGKEAALTAGIDRAEGDVVILMDADFQHPVATISDFMAKWHEGYDMVYGQREDRQEESRFKRKGAQFFYWLLNRLSSVSLPAGSGDFRLLDRQVVLALRQLPERGRFMKGLYSWVGFRSVPVMFQVQKRVGGETSYSSRRLFQLAVTGLVSFSDVPLRMWSVIGVIISTISFIFALLVVVKTLLFGADTSGWPTIVVGLLFFGGVQLISIGVLGEYIARIFKEVKQRPTYLVARQYGFERREADKQMSQENAP